MHDEEEEPLDTVDMQADEAADEAVAHAVGEVLPVVALPKIDAESELPLQAEEADVVEREPERLVLEKKHPLAIRWMHWVNFRFCLR